MIVRVRSCYVVMLNNFCLYIVIFWECVGVLVCQDSLELVVIFSVVCGMDWFANWSSCLVLKRRFCRYN